MFQSLQNKRNNEDGFTIAQVLVGAIILPTLLVISTPAIMGSLTAGKDAQVEANAFIALNAIGEYTTDNGGRLPQSLGDTEYDKFDDEAKVNAVIKGNEICLTGWNTAGGKYTVTTPYTKCVTGIAK